VAHGHEAAISIHQLCQGLPVTDRPPRGMTLVSAKAGMHAWSYSNDYDTASRAKMTHADLARRFASIDVEVELGFTAEQAAREVERCLNCDVETHFTSSACIECDACVDVCPVSCLTITTGGDELDLRTRLTAPAVNVAQPMYVSDALPQTARVMVKDEDVCLHCGLCAERCPTAAWDMRTFTLIEPYAGRGAAARGGGINKQPGFATVLR
jgi:ferredoxin